MHRSYPVWCVLAALVVFGPVGWRILTWERSRPQSVDTDMASAGEVLFEHVWEPNDPLCPNGDGLGPVFNERSCAACHHQNGVGGSSGLDHNVTTFLVLKSDGTPMRQGVVHVYATEPKYQETLQHVEPSLPAISQPSLDQIFTSTARGNLATLNESSKPRISVPSTVKLSQRKTPALFGAGLIDRIPEQAIVANQRKQQFLFGMSPGDTEVVPVGRVARLVNGRIGRFGWKAQTASLSDFVQGACATELGLGNPGQAQPVSMAMASSKSLGLDLTQLQCDQLTEFVASLPKPVERPVASKLPSSVHAGKAIFNKVGCADCHTPSLGSVEGLYSDLLLHRMGAELEGGAGNYYGAPPPTATKTITTATSAPLPDEWRTPPLWGVADSAPFMHDGRATTLDAAIRLHDGQAAGAAKRFEALPAQQQMQLVAFLESLRAP